MAETAREASSELARLKDLLLRPEANRLERLQAQVSALDQRVGNSEGLENATAEILVDAFRQAEGRQHRELARAVAPVVVAAIQSEIRNSRDMMVEALYPITGRLVAAAVADAFRSLVTNINERVDTMMSMRLWKLRLKSWLTRRSLSELLLAEASRPRLRRLLFLERGSGTLLGSWADEPSVNDRSDLVSGMIAAITEFSASVFEHESGELRTIDMGASRILLHASSRSIIAGEFTGPLNTHDEQAVYKIFERLAEQYNLGAPIASDEIEVAAQSLHALSLPATEKKSNNLGAWIVLALLLVILGYFGWRTWARTSFENRVHSAFVAEIDARPHMKAYPISLRVDHGRREITLNGLTPSAEDSQMVRNAVEAKADDYRVGGDLAVVVSQEAAIRSLEQMRASLEVLQSGAQAQAKSAESAAAQAQESAAAQAQALANLRSELEKLRQGLQAQQPVIAGIDKRLADTATSLESSVAGLQAQAADPRSAVERFTRRNAVFFERDSVLREAAVAAKMLDELAGLLLVAKTGIRVVSYSSDSGSTAINQKVAQDRARVVALMLSERGIELGRIVTAVRPYSNQINSSQDVAGHSNRRVEFETLFESEKTGP